MVRHARSAKSPVVKAAVAVLLTVAVIGALWVPIYAHTEPKLGAFPFFYWYQLILVPVTAILCWISYLLLRNRPARQTRHARQGVAAQLIGPRFREDLCLDAAAASTGPPRFRVRCSHVTRWSRTTCWHDA